MHTTDAPRRALKARPHGARLLQLALGSAFAAVLAGALASCDLATAPLPADAERFDAPAVYARWWALVEQCSGRSGDMSAVSWYRVPGWGFTHRGRDLAGYWQPRGNRIVVAAEQMHTGTIVRHEMLHALLRVHGHPHAQFVGRCAALVRCQGACIEDAGPWRSHGRTIATLPPDSLEITSDARMLPAEGDGERWLALWVSVHNPRGAAVLVAASGDRTTPPTFGYHVRGPAGGLLGGEVATDSATLYFEPFETKRWLFEFRAGAALDERTVPAGRHQVRGGYARSWSAFQTVDVP